MESAKKPAPQDELEHQPNQGRHYFAALREAWTLLIVFASIDGLFYKPMPSIHWLELGLWILVGAASLYLGVRLDRSEVDT